MMMVVIVMEATNGDGGGVNVINDNWRRHRFSRFKGTRMVVLVCGGDDYVLETNDISVGVVFIRPILS
ncbi:hypothetical protein HanPI659440_Chr12g0469941 [Helianthus annuus]|nr:hypothetical protein HanPI659440_Chr12g0469941 [Helianthus annuus]